MVVGVNTYIYISLINSPTRMLCSCVLVYYISRLSVSYRFTAAAEIRYLGFLFSRLLGETFGISFACKIKRTHTHTRKLALTHTDTRGRSLNDEVVKEKERERDNFNTCERHNYLQRGASCVALVHNKM